MRTSFIVFIFRDKPYLLPIIRIIIPSAFPNQHWVTLLVVIREITSHNYKSFFVVRHLSHELSNVFGNSPDNQFIWGTIVLCNGLLFISAAPIKKDVTLDPKWPRIIRLKSAWRKTDNETDPQGFIITSDCPSLFNSGRSRETDV